MNSLLQADIFFFISSIAAISVAILLCIALFYVIKILKDVKRTTEVVKEEVENAGDHIMELRKKISESFIFNLIFAKKKKSRKKSDY